MKIRPFAALAALLLCCVPAFAQDSESTAGSAQAFVDSLTFRDGEIAVPDAHARFKLGADFRYLDKADARRVLEEFWGNPPDDTVLGLIVPRAVGLADDGSWAVVVTYSDDGYVSDADAKDIDYAELLADMQAGTAEENEARKQAGYETVELVGWAEQPRYDADAKKLYWAKELAFEGQAGRTLNYDIRVLGRGGYLSLNAVAGMQSLPQVRAGMQELLPMTDFDEGHRYANFDASTDKVAAYGVAALIGGALASKAGLFAKLLALLVAGKKLVIPLAIGAIALASRLFKKKSAGAK